MDWKLIWAQRGFRYFFVAMFVSLFGSGMNFVGVSWYIMAATHSTVKVSLQVIVVTLPGLFIPFLGGVLIDRFDRRYLGVVLDIVRGFFVLATAYIAWSGNLHLWHLYAMTLITGTGSAMYWATVNALVQEVIPASQFTGANAAVLVGVQSGMLIAGAFVGFLYDRAGIAGILCIDGLTYFVSAFCLYSIRSGYVSPRDHLKYPREYSEATEATAEALESGENPEVAEAGLSLAVYADLKEGFAYLKKQPLVRSLGITHSIMMAGVVSANVVLVALANDILHAGARGLGFLEAGWASRRHHGRPHRQPASQLTAHAALCRGLRGARRRPHGDAVCCVPHRRCHHASSLRSLPRRRRRHRAVRTDVHRPAPFHGPHAIRHGHLHDVRAARDEFCPGDRRAGCRSGRWLCFACPALRRRHSFRLPRPPAHALVFEVPLIDFSG